jgi:hypothetical protein
VADHSRIGFPSIGGITSVAPPEPKLVSSRQSLPIPTRKVAGDSPLAPDTPKTTVSPLASVTAPTGISEAFAAFDPPTGLTSPRRSTTRGGCEVQVGSAPPGFPTVAGGIVAIVVVDGIVTVDVEVAVSGAVDDVVLELALGRPVVEHAAQLKARRAKSPAEFVAR